MASVMYVMTVEGGVEPEMLGPFHDDEAVRLVALRKHAAQDPECDATFVLVQHSENGEALEVQTYGTGTTGSLAGDGCEIGPYCSRCRLLAGPDYHLAGRGSEGETLVVCPECFEERMR